MSRYFAILFLLSLLLSATWAQDIKLPEPQITGGIPLMQALSQRRSTRQFADRELDRQTLANLLWAAYGFNRSDKRVVPSSQNRQEIDLYVFLRSGVYLYDARNNLLLEKVKGSQSKAVAGSQDYALTAPLGLVMVANMDKASNRDAACVDCGFIGQNVYLQSASENLVCVFRATMDKALISSLLGLNSKQEPLFNMCVGYPLTP